MDTSKCLVYDKRIRIESREERQESIPAKERKRTSKNLIDTLEAVVFHLTCCFGWESWAVEIDWTCHNDVTANDEFRTTILWEEKEKQDITFNSKH